MAAMDHRVTLPQSVSEHATTYVDELIRIAPPCGRPLTAAMREDVVAMVEWAMHEVMHEQRDVFRG